MVFKFAKHIQELKLNSLPGIVTDVSAILVAIIAFRVPFGAVKNTFN